LPIVINQREPCGQIFYTENAMKLKNLKIGVQLNLGFAAVLLFVFVLGLVSFLQSEKIHLQSEEMYNHPLKVRRAIGTFHADLLGIRLNMKDMFPGSDEKEIAFFLSQIETQNTDAFEQIDLIYASYLGPRMDVDSLKKEFILYNAVREETFRLLRAGKTKEVASRLKNTGIGGKQADKVLAALQKIDDFATHKGDELFGNSEELSSLLNRQLVLLVVVILLLVGLINYFLLKGIREPTLQLTAATQRFQSGDMTARSLYDSQNEFGELSASFNMLAGNIQSDMQLNEKVVSLSGLMLSKYEAKEFFRETIHALALHTGSQIAAIYLLSGDKKTFDHFESTGLGNNARQSFDAGSFDGEFGSALSSGKIQHIRDIPVDTRFVFQTVSSMFIPREIITIPILTNSSVVAIISLASVNTYNNQTLQLIFKIFDTLNARVEGILAYHKMNEFSKKLEAQNRELATQKEELSSQSAELTRQNTELEMQKKQLEESGRLKTNFLSNMSHELRTPLNSVIALSGVLSRRLAQKIPGEEYNYLEVIERNGRHLLALINDILDISRIESGHEEIGITTFDFIGLISEAVIMIHPLAEQKNIELIQTGIEAKIQVTSDAAKCSHILYNLIGNAVKFTEKGKVEVSAMVNGNDFSIKISDTGIGISEKHLPHIFEEFRQADGSASRKFGGTGLGLAIARKYANMLGGTISVKSTPGKGSEFELTLPLSYAAEKRIDPGETATRLNHPLSRMVSEPLPGSSAKTILLVDDSEPAIIQLSDFLEDSGYRILIARDGAGALGIIAQTIPDAMILDLMMPGINGFEVLQTLRNAEPTALIPVLVLSARHITSSELRFLKRNNVHELIQKGDVNRKELLTAVAAMVNPPHAKTIKSGPGPQKIDVKPLVLVVEDNPDNMLTVKALLADDFIVLEAVDGKEGLEMARENKPDFILMDIALPGMDGIEAYKAISGDSELEHIPVIALTASAMTSDREAILAYGFDGYIPKPIDESVFFRTINQTLYGK
jgi:signal transduction histidine kinase/CheY-like chemotaxis protein/HAMP domain-containing protein